MFTFNESNVCTLESDLLEKLALPENFVVAQMYYKPGSNEVYCEVRKLTPCANKFLTLDGYTVTVETGSEGGYFSIQDAVAEGWRGDFSQHIATFNPGYELQLVVDEQV